VKLKTKESAKNLLELHLKRFLGRKLKVSFPDFQFDSASGGGLPSEPEPQKTLVKNPEPEQNISKPQSEKFIEKPKEKQEQKTIEKSEEKEQKIGKMVFDDEIKIGKVEKVEKTFDVKEALKIINSAEGKINKIYIDEDVVIEMPIQKTRKPYIPKPKMKYRKKN